MGYTHYWYTKSEYDKKVFEQVATDFKLMMKPLEHLGVKLADGNGENQPTISPTEINFNGQTECGHEKRDLGITWPSAKASGVGSGKVGEQLAELTNSDWFAGATLDTRTCGGDCSHEGFNLVQSNKNKSDKFLFDCTKTAFKPYDLAVTACLIIAKHYFGDNIQVTSDGRLDNWQDAMHLCNQFLGYGLNFKLDDTSEIDSDD